MRVKKSAVVGIVLSLAILLVPAQGVVIEPTNVVEPTSPGPLSFDYAINNPMGTSAQAFQSTISISGPPTLTFDGTASQGVSGTGSYWVFGNSAGATALDLGGGSYQFGDGPDDGFAQPLSVGDIMARYSFTWAGGAFGWTVTLDTSLSNSFVMNEFFMNEALEFTPGQYPPGQTANSFYITPEPSTLVLLALGGAGLLKRRRR